MIQLCLKCNSNQAPTHPTLGYLLCASCSTDTVNITTHLPYEFVPDSLKQSRKEYAKDILQSSRDGVLSQERLDAYGTRGLKVTPEQIKNARYIWNDIKPYKEGNPKLI